MEGCRVNGEYEPWTTSNILEAADAEVGPGCCDESYGKLRDVMEAAPELLAALELLATDEYEPYSDAGDWGGITITLKDVNAIKAAIAKARGL